MNLGAMTKDNCRGLAKRLESDGHGKTKIGRVVFTDIDQVKPVPACGQLLLPENERLNDLLEKLDGIAIEAGESGLPAQIKEHHWAHMRLAVLEWLRTL